MKRTLLYCLLLFIPVAILTCFVMVGVDPFTGFYDGSPFLLFLEFAAVLAAVSIGISLSSRAARHGVPFSEPVHGKLWKSVNIVLALLVLANVILKFIYSKPTDAHMLTLWIISVVFEDIALVCILLRAFAGPSDDPLRKVIHSVGPCLFFTAELLTRFFSSSVNKNNIPLMISFLACGALAVSSLRMLQTLSFGETSTQRQFAAAAYVTIVICLGIRLPSVIFYSVKGTLFDLVCLALDCVASIVLFHEAYLTIPDTD
ncbi:MAG: hypothetical protein II464_00830 [Oscillospiraceae bacterium]|nr:hypothetical protein [Oscillospiraceae bacterium]MBQ4000354.1 hypothetical protein [Oscillospiraceae bacterium]MBQ4240433.1 hypothetical protein [Oscillospiraceae bacterium]